MIPSEHVSENMENIAIQLIDEIERNVEIIPSNELRKKKTMQVELEFDLEKTIEYIYKQKYTRKEMLCINTWLHIHDEDTTNRTDEDEAWVNQP